MKIYFAGTPGIKERERVWMRLIKRRLLSFWDISKEQFWVKEAFEMYISMIRKDKG